MHLILKANEAGPASSTQAYQDLRYSKAFVFTDWNADCEFETLATYGVSSPSGNPDNILANYNTVMNIDQQILVPEDAVLGKSRIRVLYNNAWKPDAQACGTSLTDGMAYDLNVEVIDPGQVGISHESSPEIVYIHPNPTSGKCILHFPSKGKYVVSVYSAEGNPVSTNEYSTQAANESRELTINGKKGVYIVKILEGKNLYLETVKIVKI